MAMLCQTGELYVNPSEYYNTHSNDLWLVSSSPSIRLMKEEVGACGVYFCVICSRHRVCRLILVISRTFISPD
jgi:hypothetical protein